MSKYIETAKATNKLVTELLEMVSDENHHAAAVLIGQIYNQGMKSNPRPCNTTIRLRATREAMQGTTVDLRIVDVDSDRGSFKALSIS